MKKVIRFNKKIGETPLEAIGRFKLAHRKYSKSKISYAGRLDPMAEGELLLLVDEENKKRRQYEKLDKEYLFEILFGIATDSGDILGVILDSENKIGVSKKKIENALLCIKERNYQYPPVFSSVPVNGKPLYYWARKKSINKIKIPKRKISVYSIELVDLYNISVKKLEKIANNRINLVNGDFRQEEILLSWKKYFSSTSSLIFKIALVKLKCSSGTYVRSIAADLGKVLKTPCLALSIKRTKVFNGFA